MRKESILLFIVAMLFIAGCTDGNDNSSGSVVPFIGGTDSVDIMFEEGAPPGEVYAGNQYPFDIIVTMNNVGEYDVNAEDVRVTIGGFNPALFGLDELQKSPLDDLIATKKDPEGNILEGTTSSVEFLDLNYQDNLDATIGNLPVVADVCYKYGTKARAKICVKKNVLSTKGDSICDINGEKSVQNSAGPVHITELKEAAQGTNKLVISFKVVHLGDGQVYVPESFCPDERGSENRVWLDINTGLEGLQCTGITSGSSTSGEVNLGVNGERTVRCTLDLSNIATDFEQSMSFELVYDYFKTLETGLTVRPNE
ncbi:MAG: hypothetical protein ACLFPQ_03275 [Candidatus Woesearchaeota archaeon]